MKLLIKRNPCGIRGVSNDWLKSHLSNWKHYDSINGYEGKLKGKLWSSINKKDARSYNCRNPV